jgi:hypothetical protein
VGIEVGWAIRQDNRTIRLPKIIRWARLAWSGYRTCMTWWVIGKAQTPPVLYPYVRLKR